MSSPPGGGGLGGFLARRLFGSAISNAVGYALGGAIQPSLAPLVQDIENEAWQTHPVLPLSAGQVAAAELRELLDGVDAATEASFTGIDETRLALLRRLSGQAPALDTLLALRRRDAIDQGELDRGLAQLGYLPEWRPRLRALRNVLPSVTDLVHMAVREVFDPGQRAALDLDAEFPAAFAERADALGVSPELAADYWADHWQLPSAEQMAQMRFRGELDAGAFSRGLRALDYAPTWRAKLEAILRPIPPLSDMIRFAVRDVYTPATVAKFGLDDDFPAVFAQEAALHGMEEPYPQQYWAAHWRLPSALQGFRMLHRGIAQPDELDVLLKALDYPPFWRSRLRELAFLVPGRIDLKRYLRHGIVDRAEVVAGYRRLGYAPVDAERMTQVAEAEVSAGGPSDTHLSKARTSLFNRVHTEYVSRQLTEAEALAGLDAAGVPDAQRAAIVDLWTTESSLIRTELTQAQILKAYRKGRYTEAEALAELVERGLTEGDAQIRLQSG